jgi:hypothetical protein
MEEVTPALLDKLIVRPTLEWLGPVFNTPGRRLLLIAIAMQESGLRDRLQIDENGKVLPHLGRSWWQFERGTVGLVLAHERCLWLPYRVQELGYNPTPHGVHDAMAHNDILGCAMGAALLWSDLKRLPSIGDEKSAWACYMRNWNPGKPRPQDWPENYALAMGTVLGEESALVA